MKSLEEIGDHWALQKKIRLIRSAEQELTEGIASGTSMWIFLGINLIIGAGYVYFTSIQKEFPLLSIDSIYSALLYSLISIVIELVKQKFILMITKKVSVHAKKYLRTFFNFSEIMKFNKKIIEVSKADEDYDLIEKLASTRENVSNLVFTMLNERVLNLSNTQCTKESEEIYKIAKKYLVSGHKDNLDVLMNSKLCTGNEIIEDKKSVFVLKSI